MVIRMDTGGRGRFELQTLALVESVALTDASAEVAARQRHARLTKPAGSLGRLEDVSARVARIQGTDRPDVRQKAMLLAAADHGVTAQGVSPYPKDVTWQMVANIASGGAAISQLAQWAGAALVVVDVGVDRDLAGIGGIRHAKVARGTRDMTEGPAMSREQACEAMLVGAALASELADDGVRMIGLGEMGIGNSTSAAALTAVFTGADPADVVGPGTGLSSEGVEHKAEVVGRALDANAQVTDPIGVLASLGGLEIACLAGAAIGGAARRLVIVADGFISGAAALAAERICSACHDYILPSHLSAEPGHARVLEALDARPILDLDMRLGEGSGAALAMGVIDAACRVLSGMATFEDAGVANRDA